MMFCEHSKQVAGLKRVSAVLGSGTFSQKKVEVYVGRVMVGTMGTLVRVPCQESVDVLEVRETGFVTLEVCHVQVWCNERKVLNIAGFKDVAGKVVSISDMYGEEKGHVKYISIPQQWIWIKCSPYWSYNVQSEQIILLGAGRPPDMYGVRVLGRGFTIHRLSFKIPGD